MVINLPALSIQSQAARLSAIQQVCRQFRRRRQRRFLAFPVQRLVKLGLQGQRVAPSQSALKQRPGRQRIAEYVWHYPIKRDGTSRVGCHNGQISITGGWPSFGGCNTGIYRRASIGCSGSQTGSVTFANATSGTVTIQSVSGALGSSVLSLPLRSILWLESYDRHADQQNYRYGNDRQHFQNKWEYGQAVTGNGNTVALKRLLFL